MENYLIHYAKGSSSKNHLYLSKHTSKNGKVVYKYAGKEYEYDKDQESIELGKKIVKTLLDSSIETLDNYSKSNIEKQQKEKEIKDKKLKKDISKNTKKLLFKISN